MWKARIPNPFLNCNKIHPLQQKKVRTLLDELDTTHIEKIEIFGSSISDRCHVGSDVDVYITLNKDVRRLIHTYIPYEYDLWTNYTVDDRLLAEIKKDCVTVYQKGENENIVR